MAKKNPVFAAGLPLERLEGLLEGRIARAVYCLDQLVTCTDKVQRQNFIDIAKAELALLERALKKL